MSTLSDIETRRIRDETIRHVIARLTQNAQDESTIGRRCLAWKFQLTRHQTRQRLVDFAKRMAVSKQAAHKHATSAQAAIFDIRVDASSMTEKT